MPRRIRSIMFWLIVGAVINLAAAWACVAWGTLKGVHGQTVRPANARPDVPESGAWLAPVHLDWPVRVPTDWPEAHAIAWSASFGVEWRAGATGWDDPKRTVQALWSGWPMRSLRWVQREVRDGAGVSTSWSMGVGPLVARSGQQGPGTMSNSGWATGRGGCRAACR